MWEERADLAGDLLALDGRADGATIGVSQDNNYLRAQDSGAILQAADDLRRDDVARDAGDKDVANALVENKFDGDAGVGAGQDGSEWLLFVSRVLLEDGKIVVVRGELSRDKPLVALHQ